MGTTSFQETESPEGKLAGSVPVYCLCVPKVRTVAEGLAVALKAPAHPAG